MDCSHALEHTAMPPRARSYVVAQQAQAEHSVLLQATHRLDCSHASHLCTMHSGQDRIPRDYSPLSVVVIVQPEVAQCRSACLCARWVDALDLAQERLGALVQQRGAHLWAPVCADGRELNTHVE